MEGQTVIGGETVIGEMKSISNSKNKFCNEKLSIRRLIPNLITFISLTFGLLAIKLAIDQKWKLWLC